MNFNPLIATLKPQISSAVSMWRLKG